MTQKETKILETFRRLIPELAEEKKSELLAYAEGVAFMADRQRDQKTA